MWVLPVRLLPMAMTFSLPVHVLTAGQLHDQLLVHRWDSQEVEGVQALCGGEAGRPDPAINYPMMAVYQLKL